MGSFCKITFSCRASWRGKTTPALCGLNLSDTIFRIFESTGVAGAGVLALLVGLTAVDFGRWIGQFSIRQSSRVLAS